MGTTTLNLHRPSKVLTIADTVDNTGLTGVFRMRVVNLATITTMTISNEDGSATAFNGVTLAAGTEVEGLITQIQLASGIVQLFKA